MLVSDTDSTCCVSTLSAFTIAFHARGIVRARSRFTIRGEGRGQFVVKLCDNGIGLSSPTGELEMLVLFPALLTLISEDLLLTGRLPRRRENFAAQLRLSIELSVSSTSITCRWPVEVNSTLVSAFLKNFLLIKKKVCYRRLEET